MTKNNEEKAKKITDRIFESGFNTNRTFYDMAKNAAMEMARWKDEQLEAEKQALIDKACEWLSKNIESDKYLSPDEESYRMGCGVDYLETNMFIEDFKNFSCGLIERNGR